MLNLPASLATLLILGIALRFLVYLIYARRGPARGDLVYAVLDMASLLLVGLGTVGVLVVFMLSGWAASLMGLVLLIVVGAMLEMAVFQGRETDRRATAAALAVAAERQLPLGPTLTAVAADQRAVVRNATGQLAEMLESGVALSEALRQSRRAVPELASTFARVGEETGAVPAALRASAAQGDFRVWVRQRLFGRISYLAAVAALGLLVVAFVMIKIVPAFQKIFDDFEMELPQVTLTLIAVSQFIVNWWFLFLPLFLVAVGVLILVGLDYMGLLPELPLGNLARPYHAGIVLQGLSLAAERDLPLGPTLQTLAEWYPRVVVRRQLADVAARVAGGDDWCRALESVRYVSPADAALLRAGERTGNLAWALRTAADGRLRRLFLRLQAALELGFPPLVLFAGLVVMWFAVGLFLPLVKLIMGVA